MTKKSVSLNEPGTVKFKPESIEAMWSVYNIISSGDEITAATDRKVSTSSGSGQNSTQRVRFNIRLEVVSLSFDPNSGEIRVKGRNVKEKCWDKFAILFLEEILSPAKNAELAVVLLDVGQANIYLVGGSMTHHLSKITHNIPRKRASVQAQETATLSFFNQVLNSIENSVDAEHVKAIAIGSAGFLKDDFYSFLQKSLVSTPASYPRLRGNRDKLVVVPSIGISFRSLSTLLSNPLVSSKIADTKVVRELKSLDEFRKTLRVNPDLAQYGWKHVRAAASEHAVASLLIGDYLLHAASPQNRKILSTLIDDVTSDGGEVFFFSRFHSSGEQVREYGGVLAILRYAVYDLDEMAAAISVDPTKFVNLKESGKHEEDDEVKDGNVGDVYTPYDSDFEEHSYDSDASDLAVTL